MLLVTSLLHWWYTDGWRKQVFLVSNRLEGTLDYFSIDLLLKTLFAPFRQISVGKVDGPLEVKMRALIDKLFSRVIGAFIRLMIIIIGCVMIVFQLAIGIIMLIGWALFPILPFVGIVLVVIGRTT